MRELERIDRICDLLKEKWKNHPDLRLGQFFINYIFNVPTGADLSMWNQSDTVTEKQLKELFK